MWYCARVGLRAVSHCAESDPTQYHTAPSREIEMSENPKLSNTARSWTPRSVILHRVGLLAVLACTKSNNFLLFDFRKLIFPWLLESMWWYFEKISKIQKWLTLHRVRVHAVWYCTESDFAQYNTERSQQLKLTAYPKRSNTSRSFAGNNFVFAGLSLASMRI